MTLNITVISPHGIHQSADFRLAAIEQDAGGNWKALVDNSPKVITVSDETWEGFITYCGMGMWSHKQTYQFVADWLCSEKPRSLSFDEACEILQKEGSRWIGEIERCVRRFQGHTFTVGGFDRGTPRVEIISNYESTKGKIPRLMGGRLSRSSLSTATVPHVIVTGLDNAVGQEDRLLLKRLVKAKVEHNVIRVRLGRINAKASQSLQAKNGVSESCLCYSIDRHGAGQGDITGKIKGEFKPLSIMFGMNMTARLQEFLPPDVQTGAAHFATSRSSTATAAGVVVCSPSVVHPEGATPWQARVLSEINVNECSVELKSLNVGGTLVGQLKYPVSQQPRAVVLRPGNPMLAIGTLGGATSTATDVNSSNSVVGSAQRADGKHRAFLWKPGAQMIDLGTFGERSSTATAINDQGQVVGHCNLTQASEGGPTEQAFFWSDELEMQPIPGLENCWSRAIDINDKGTVIGWCAQGRSKCSFAWSVSGGLSFLFGPRGENCFVNSINAAGVVVGEYEHVDGERRAVMWSEHLECRELGVPPALHPCGIDESGYVILRDRARPWRRPWIFTADHTFAPLPYVPDHHTQVNAVRGNLLVGQAHTESWKHNHPVLWTIVR